MIQRLAKGVGKPKPTPICPFLFHIYEGQRLLTAEEELDYRTAKEMAGYRITPDPDSRPGSDEDKPAPTPAPSPRLGPSQTPTKRRKSIYKAPSGSPLVRSRGPLVQFHRNHSQRNSNRRIDQRKDRSRWTSLLPASHEDSGKLGINMNQWRRCWSRSAPSLG